MAPGGPGEREGVATKKYGIAPELLLLEYLALYALWPRAHARSRSFSDTFCSTLFRPAKLTPGRTNTHKGCMWKKLVAASLGRPRRPSSWQIGSIRALACGLAMNRRLADRRRLPEQPRTATGPDRPRHDPRCCLVGYPRTARPFAGCSARLTACHFEHDVNIGFPRDSHTATSPDTPTEYL